MKSPFPGMDPYLERYWRSVHHSLIADAQEQLNEQLPSDLLAVVGERVFIEPSHDSRHVYPDVYVAEYPSSPTWTDSGGSSAAVAEPIVITLSAEPARQAFLEIREAGTGNAVITVIEFISPTNKQPGEGRTLYLQKQQECIDAHVSLVEIDLIRHGAWVLAVPRDRVPPKRLAEYRACIRRGWRSIEAEYYPIPLRERLPNLRIPLRETDPAVTLDLQSLIDRSYQRGRLGHGIDYNEPVDPPLAEADAAWADELLRAAGRRGTKQV